MSMKLKIVNIFNRKKIILLFMGIFISSVLGSWYFFSQQAKAQKSISIPPPEMSILDDRAIPEPPADLALPEPSPPAKDLPQADQISVLILGYGGPGHQGGFLTDVIIQAKLDFVAKKLTLIHIPRDIWVNLPSGNSSIATKINAALPLGLKVGNYPTKDVAKDAVIRGAYLTKQAVGQITNIPVDLVIAIDFTRFGQAINALRGIDVTVTKTLDDPWYPVTGLELELCGKTPEEVTQLSNSLSGFELEKQFPCRYEQLHFDPGIVHMDGETALKFARSRHTTSDFDRGLRQIQVLLGIQNKLFSLKALDNIPQFFTTLSKAVKTDLNQELLTALAPRLVELPQFSVATIGLSTANVLASTKTQTGAQALIPQSGQGNFGAIHAFIANH
jgi:anionic cell wall polymer biosynthesis LytR-Cps2A-Psr (LCP) family protein